MNEEDPSRRHELPRHFVERVLFMPSSTVDTSRVDGRHLLRHSSISHSLCVYPMTNMLGRFRFLTISKAVYLTNIYRSSLRFTVSVLHVNQNEQVI